MQEVLARLKIPLATWELSRYLVVSHTSNGQHIKVTVAATENDHTIPASIFKSIEVACVKSSSPDQVMSINLLEEPFQVGYNTGELTSSWIAIKLVFMGHYYEKPTIVYHNMSDSAFVMHTLVFQPMTNRWIHKLGAITPENLTLLPSCLSKWM